MKYENTNNMTPRKNFEIQKKRNEFPENATDIFPEGSSER